MNGENWRILAFTLPLGCLLLWLARKTGRAIGSLLARALHLGRRPEQKWAVTLENSVVQCAGPQKGEQAFPLSQLERIRIETTAEGPWKPDVFWVLEGKGGETLRFPQGAQGEDRIRKAFFELPGFDLEAAIQALFSAERRSFDCWSKDQERPRA